MFLFTSHDPHQLTFYLTFYLTFHLTFYLTFFFWHWFWLILRPPVWHTCWHFIEGCIWNVLWYFMVHVFLFSIWHISLHRRSEILSNICSDIPCDILPGILSDIVSHIWSNIYSCVLSDTLCGILSNIYCVFDLNAIWHSIWHISCDICWLMLQYLTSYLALDRAFRVTFFDMSFQISGKACFLAHYLTYWHGVRHTFDILRLHSIWFYLTCFPTYVLTSCNSTLHVCTLCTFFRIAYT